jgi:hypothetical protein
MTVSYGSAGMNWQSGITIRWFGIVLPVIYDAKSVENIPENFLGSPSPPGSSALDWRTVSHLASGGGTPQPHERPVHLLSQTMVQK